MIKKKSRKRRGGSDHTQSLSEKLSTWVQEGHRQTGLKNFPEAVRLYSLVIRNLEDQNSLFPSSPYAMAETVDGPSPLSSSDDEGMEKRDDFSSTDSFVTPLYVLYGCRSQAYQGMQQFDLALIDAESSIRHNPHHALAYVQKGKTLYAQGKYKEALRTYEEGLKRADPNHAGLRRLIEILLQETQGSSIIRSARGVSLIEDSSKMADRESKERQVEESYLTDTRAARRQGEWEIVPCTGTELLRPRHAYAAALLSSQHAWYIFGGYAEKGEHMGDFYCFYFPSRTWYKLPVEGQAPKSKHSATLVAVEEKSRLYLFGGTADEGYLEELHSFDIENRTWSQILPKEGELWPPKRWSHTMTYCPKRKKIFVFGGVSVSLSMLNDLWSFDIETTQWTKILPQSDVVPGPRHVHTLCLYEDNLYVYGGFGGRVNYHDFYRFDLNTREWHLISDQVEGRRGHAAVVYDNWLYVFGGRGRNGNSSSTLRVSTQTGHMEELETLSRPMARHYISAAQWGGSMWVFGGIGRSNYNDMARFWLSSPNRVCVQSSSVGQELKFMVNNAQFADVCFLTKEHRTVHGHRSILYARCEHFRGMFDSGMRECYSQTPIDFTHIDHDVFIQVLTWIYAGTIDEDLEGGQILELLKLADQFLLHELRRVCAHMLRRFIKEENVDDFLELAESHNSPQLQIFCQQFLEDHSI